MGLTHRSGRSSSQTGEHWFAGEPKELWPRERDFVDWLIANLDQLGACLGMTLAFAGREVGISEWWSDDGNGRELMFGRRLDIDARNEHGQRVIIEAQHGPTDHKHLGQVVSYARQTQAPHIVWVVTAAPFDSTFCDDHLEALAEQNEAFAGRRTFTVVEAALESPRRPTWIEDDPMAPMLRRIDLTTMTYAPAPAPASA